MRRLLLIPPAALVIYTLSRLLAPTDLLRLTFRIEVVVAAALAALGCWFGRQRFHKGDYLRNAWTLSLAANLLITLSACMRFPVVPSRTLLLARGSVLVFENALSVMSMWLFARAYRVAGIRLPGSRRKQIAIGVTAALVAATIAGPPLWTELHRLTNGSLDAIAGVVSSLGDIITLSLIAPLFLTALAMRGGLLVWPWSFMTASTLSWLLHDAQILIGPYLIGASTPTVIIWADLWRIMACVLMLPAGLAQRRLSGGAPISSAPN